VTGRVSPSKSLIVGLREAAGLTQEEAAKRAGMSVRGLSNLERGLVSRPRRASLEALAGALELTDRNRRRLFDRYRPAPLPGAEAAPGWRGPRSHLRELVGREPELAELADALREHDLVTVTGPGGCGKTALALAAAATGRRPVTVLGLASLAQPQQLVPALATVLQVRPGGAEETLEAVEQALSGGGQLLVVDNAEHLAESVAELVIRLRGGCPGLIVLVTSREPLGLSEELVWRLLPLRAPVDDADARAPAAVLFRRRTREALPTADLSDAGAVGRVCRRLDGLPLALELAAARVRALPVPQLADRLERGDDLLTSAVPGPSGRRTLEETIDWSYQLLDGPEQRALTQLSVFRGGFTADAVEAVVSVGVNPVAIAAQLVDRSLLQAEPEGGRWTMLRTIRDYAAQRLAGSGELAATRRRHLDYWLERGRRLNTISGFGDRLAAARGMSGDLADAEHALAGGVEAGRCVEVVDLAQLLADCWNVAPGYVAHGLRWLSVVDRLGEQCPPRLRAIARTCRGQLLSVLGDMAAGHAQLRAALADADALTAAERLDMIGMISLVEIGTLDPAALGRAAQLVAGAAACPDDHHAAALSVATDIELQYGRVEEAEAISARLDELLRRAAGWLAADHHGQQARLAALRGDGPAAREALRAATATAESLGAARRFRLRLTIAEVLLAVDAAQDAYDHVTGELRTLAGGAPEMRTKAPILKVPMAEALRRLGRPGAAAALREGLATLRADKQGEVSLAGVLIAAAILRDDGDTAAAAELAADWQRLRLALGLPVPAPYRRTVADLGLDPVAPDPSRARPAGPELDALLSRAARAVSP
jgi:predicted ATPase/DNA-binding XRE family transcriptional regulator